MFDVKTTVEASELVLIADVKDHLNITHSDADTYLTALIPKARKAIEKYCGIAIGTQTKLWTVDLCAYNEYVFPYNPIISVTGVTLKTSTSTYEAVTVDDDYETDGELIKTFKPFVTGRYKITYTTGYTAIPEELKHAILIQCAYWYENRGEEGNGLCEASRTAAKGFKDYSWL